MRMFSEVKVRQFIKQQSKPDTSGGNLTQPIVAQAVTKFRMPQQAEPCWGISPIRVVERSGYLREITHGHRTCF
jgi:hypothetical protein